MATVHETIYSALVAAATSAADRFFPIVNNSNPLVVPFGIYQRISNVPESVLSGPAPIANSHWQIDVFAADEAGAQSLATAVAAAMQALAPATLPNWAGASSDTYDAEVKLFRVTMDFSVWI